MGEDVLAVAGLGDAGLVEPEAVGISAVHGDHFVGRPFGAVPAGVGIEGDVDAEFDGKSFEGEEIFGSIAGFIVELDAYHWAAVFVKEAGELFLDLCVIEGGVAHESWVVAADDFGFLEEPIG